jgi:hypothetical protein
MPPLPNVPGVIRVVLEGTSSSRNWANVFHVQYTGSAPNPVSLSDYLNAWYAVVAAALAPLMNSEGAISGATAVDLTSPTSASAEVSATTPGTRTGVPIPASAAALVNYNSSFRYRGGHPRTYYFVGCQADMLNQSNWTTSFQGNVQDLADSMRGYLGAGVIDATDYTQQCAVSYWEANVRRVAPLVMPIAVATASGGIATQRRRMRKG